MCAIKRCQEATCVATRGNLHAVFGPSVHTATSCAMSPLPPDIAEEETRGRQHEKNSRYERAVGGFNSHNPSPAERTCHASGEGNRGEGMGQEPHASPPFPFIFCQPVNRSSCVVPVRNWNICVTVNFFDWHCDNSVPYHHHHNRDRTYGSTLHSGTDCLVCT